MRTKLLLLLSALVLLPASIAAQQSISANPSTTSEPQAVALVQKALAALTGGAPVTDVTLTGTARRIAGSDDETGTATLTATSAGDSKVTLNLPSGVRSETRNHSALPLPGTLPTSVPANIAQQPQPVGAWSAPDGAIHGMPSHNIMTDAAWFFPALTLASVASQNYVLSYVGPETLSSGQAVVHVSALRPFVLPSGAPFPPGPPGTSFTVFIQHLTQMDIYLDPTTALPVALAFDIHPDGNALIDIPVQVQFSNYQSTSGLQVPLHVEKFLNNGLVLDLQFTNETFNSGLNASSFQLQ